MTKLTKRTVDATEIRSSDYVLWDDDLPGFGLRVFKSGKRSYVVQYRTAGRSRRVTIGLHGVWNPEEARREAKALLGQVARGGNPAEERKLDREAITVKELCTRYLEDLRNGLVLGKKRTTEEGHDGRFLIVISGHAMFSPTESATKKIASHLPLLHQAVAISLLAAQTVANGRTGPRRPFVVDVSG